MFREHDTELHSFQWLLVESEHDGGVGRGHVESDDLDRLDGKVRIFADAAGFAAPKGRPCAFAAPSAATGGSAPRNACGVPFLVERAKLSSLARSSGVKMIGVASPRLLMQP